MPLKSGGAVESEFMRGRVNSGLISMGRVTVVPPPPPYTPEFYDGFETGDFSKWNIATTVQVITSPTHHGNYAARSTNDATASLRHNITPGAVQSYFVRFFGYFSSMTGTGGRLLYDIFDSIGNEIMQLQLYRLNAAQIWRLALLDWDAGWTEGTTEVTAGWHCIEIQVTIGATTTTYNVWLDGNLEITKTSSNPSNLAFFILYPYYVTTTPKMDIDCVIGDTTRPTCTYYSNLGV